MKSTMKVEVLSQHLQQFKFKETFEGLVIMPNLTPTKLVKEDGSKSYSTVGNLKQAAEAAARRYNCNLNFVDKTHRKMAAKKASKR